MDKSRLRDGEPLFVQALKIIDAAEAIIGPFSWSFGGTVLMLKYQFFDNRKTFDDCTGALARALRL